MMPKWLKKLFKKDDAPAIPVLPKRDMGILLKEYQLEMWYLKTIANKNLGKVPEEEYAELKKIEEEIIEQQLDPLQRDVFRIFARRKFNIVDLIPDWKEDMKKVNKEICHFLQYGSPFPLKSGRQYLPFSGNNFFFWMLEEAKEDEGKKRFENLSLFFKEAKEKGIIFGYKVSEEELQNIAGRLIVVFSGEWVLQSAVLLDILCQVKGGEAFVKEVLDIQE